MSGGAAKTLPEVIRRALERFSADIRVAVPARIEKFDPATGLADVKPLLRDFFDDGVEVTSVSVPVITNVPCQFPGAGGFRLSFPVKAGDGCLLVFSDRSLDLWISKGGEVDPVDPRRHALSDAVALLGVTDAAHPWHNVATDRATIGHDGSGPRAEFLANEIRLDGGTEPVARVGDTVAPATSMATWLTNVAAALKLITVGPVSSAAATACATAGAAAPSDFGTVSSGAARVKA